LKSEGKHIVILGAGESGVGAAILAQKMGWAVYVSDFGLIKENFKSELNDNSIKWEEGGHNLDVILNADIVVKSPGIPDKAAVIVKIKEKGIRIVSEIEFAGFYNKAKTICITGSNGKTTTTMIRNSSKCANKHQHE
jgi:UDP-N-acetylmuramoylalanine--D-glutamate ligase